MEKSIGTQLFKPVHKFSEQCAFEPKFNNLRLTLEHLRGLAIFLLKTALNSPSKSLLTLGTINSNTQNNLINKHFKNIKFETNKLQRIQVKQRDELGTTNNTPKDGSPQ